MFYIEFRACRKKNEWKRLKNERDMGLRSFGRNPVAGKTSPATWGWGWRNIPSKLTEYSDAVKVNRIFQEYSWRRQLTPSVCTARGRRVWPCLGRRVGAREQSKNYFKNITTLVTSCRSRWYIQIPKLTFVWKVIYVVRLCAVNDGFAINSRIGETYPADERSHSRLGGYDPSTYQWVGFCF